MSNSLRQAGRADHRRNIPVPGMRRGFGTVVVPSILVFVVITIVVEVIAVMIPIMLTFRRARSRS